MHTPYTQRTINKQARNQRFEHASKTKTHKSKTNRKTNKQETHGILYRNLFRFFVRKAMFQKMTKWHVCYAHTIHQTNEKQTSKKQTICKQAKQTIYEQATLKQKHTRAKPSEKQTSKKHMKFCTLTCFDFLSEKQSFKK